MVEDSNIKERVEEYLKKVFPDREELSVKNFNELTGGASYGIYIFTVSWRDAQGANAEDLVLRREPDVGLVPPYDIRREYEVLKRVYAAGIPVPKVYCYEDDRAVLERPFVLMEKMGDGVSLFNAWMKQPERRAQMAKDYCAILAKIHGLDWKACDLSFLGMPENDRSYAVSQIARWEKVVEENRYAASPITAEIFSWLKNNIPPAESTTLCHGDYSVFNAQAGNGRVIGILDWEMVSLGDPVSDLGWACFFCEFMGVPGFDETGFIRGYEEITGKTVSERSLLFWKVFSNVKGLSIAVAATRAGIESKRINMILAVVFQQGIPKNLEKAARLIGF